MSARFVFCGGGEVSTAFSDREHRVCLAVFGSRLNLLFVKFPELFCAIAEVQLFLLSCASSCASAEKELLRQRRVRHGEEEVEVFDEEEEEQGWQEEEGQQRRWIFIEFFFEFVLLDCGET